jgi:hypothetical protein
MNWGISNEFSADWYSRRFTISTPIITNTSKSDYL